MENTVERGLLGRLFRDKASKMKDARMKMEAEQSVGYPTGYLNLDFKNGAVVHVNYENKEYSYYSVGVADGSMIMVIGRSGCGKTTFVEQAAANIIRPFNTSVVFEDQIEVGSNLTRKEIITGFRGEELKERFVIRDTGINAENFYERVKMIHDMKLDNKDKFEYCTNLRDTYGNLIYKLEPTVYILDSLALLMPEKLTEEEELSGQMSATAMARTNAGVFKRIVPLLKAANIILFVINHINQKIEINPMMHTKGQLSYLKQGESLPGGNAPIYLSNNIFRFDDGTKLKSTEGFGIDGSMVEVGLVKSRSNKAGQSTTLVFNQAIGFDPELSLFVMLKNAGRINGAGAYLYIDDASDMKFNQRQFKEKLATNPEFMQVFMNAVMDELRKSLADSTPTVSESTANSNTASNIMQMMNAKAFVA